MDSLGDRLKDLRGLRTQNEVAKALGMAQQLYRTYENDEHLPGTKLIMKICKYYSCSADWLLGIDRDTSAAPQINQTAVGNNNRLTATVGNAGEMPICRSCPKVTALQETLAMIMQAARTAAAKPPRKTR